MPGGEVINLWTGQCGVQMGNSCWELYALEHCISADGKLCADVTEDTDKTYESYFSLTQAGKYVPRTLLIDLEPTVIDEIKMGQYRRLFNPSTLITGKEDAANNFARGFYNCSHDVMRRVIQTTRNIVENCDHNQGFMIHHSFGGGTGSGFTSLLLEYLSMEYGKTAKLEYGIFPSNTFTSSCVEPYNCVLSMHTPMENADMAGFFENEALYRIISSNMEIKNITFTPINRLIAQVLSGITAPLRFEGQLNNTIFDYQINLVPYPRIHFPLLSYSPVLSEQKMNHSSGTCKDITDQVFSEDSHMISLPQSDGKYMSICLLYRGDNSALDINNAIKSIKANRYMSWVDWCPTGFKIGMNSQPMISIPGSGIGYSPRSITMLSSTTLFRSMIKNMNMQFMMLFYRRAFVHWYVSEGMEESEFEDAFDDVIMLENDYEMIDSSFGGDGSTQDVSEIKTCGSKHTSTDKTGKSCQLNIDPSVQLKTDENDQSNTDENDQLYTDESNQSNIDESDGDNEDICGTTNKNSRNQANTYPMRSGDKTSQSSTLIEQGNLKNLMKFIEIDLLAIDEKLTHMKTSSSDNENIRTVEKKQIVLIEFYNYLHNFKTHPSSDTSTKSVNLINSSNDGITN